MKRLTRAEVDVLSGALKRLKTDKGLREAFMRAMHRRMENIFAESAGAKSWLEMPASKRAAIEQKMSSDREFFRAFPDVMTSLLFESPEFLQEAITETEKAKKGRR